MWLCAAQWGHDCMTRDLQWGIHILDIFIKVGVILQIQSKYQLVHREAQL